MGNGSKDFERGQELERRTTAVWELVQKWKFCVYEADIYNAVGYLPVKNKKRALVNCGEFFSSIPIFDLRRPPPPPPPKLPKGSLSLVKSKTGNLSLSQDSGNLSEVDSVELTKTHRPWWAFWRK